MSERISLKQAERRAFTAAFQDCMFMVYWLLFRRSSASGYTQTKAPPTTAFR
jgi:hypothetical protein